jgi:hypothetical protein
MKTFFLLLKQLQTLDDVGARDSLLKLSNEIDNDSDFWTLCGILNELYPSSLRLSMSWNIYWVQNVEIIRQDSGIVFISEDYGSTFYNRKNKSETFKTSKL